jgi:hypothetical protein
VRTPFSRGLPSSTWSWSPRGASVTKGLGHRWWLTRPAYRRRSAADDAGVRRQPCHHIGEPDMVWALPKGGKAAPMETVATAVSEGGGPTVATLE